MLSLGVGCGQEGNEVGLGKEPGVCEGMVEVGPSVAICTWILSLKPFLRKNPGSPWALQQNGWRGPMRPIDNQGAYYG